MTVLSCVYLHHTLISLILIGSVVCVGGDGMFSEIIHGLISRTQRDSGIDQNRSDEDLVPCTLRIGIIPAGEFERKWLRLVYFSCFACYPHLEVSFDRPSCLPDRIRSLYVLHHKSRTSSGVCYLENNHRRLVCQRAAITRFICRGTKRLLL